MNGRRVLHTRFGSGTVLVDRGDSLVVRFDHGIEECEKSSLRETADPRVRARGDRWDLPLEVVNRIQAWTIRSMNDSWGVFSRSRIELLPHQLWVCHKVGESWPARWLVADDVGLGKTIEAGMILLPLLARGRVRRLLILCPAALVEQWQYRMRTMFDIRVTRYSVEADTPRSDFWGGHSQVVASIQTLRMKNEARQNRMLESDPWDLVLVDEAHHLNADEETGPTLGYKLVKALNNANRVQSMIFFTGTPHRGKDFGFLSLLSLLRQDLFDPRRDLGAQLLELPKVMIRNNKTTVTDLRGNRLFAKPNTIAETYQYSPAEERFYDMLTSFIRQGRAYASGLEGVQGRAVMLVLIAMQKLASSSVAAIRKAVAGRIQRLGNQRDKIDEVKELIRQYQAFESDGAGDELSTMEEKLPVFEAKLKLMENEEAALRELLAAADEVTRETKIERICELVASDLPGKNVLFFTEYKATQTCLMNALEDRFGPNVATFINGDDRADGVRLADGSYGSRSLRREDAAGQFNSGQVRFLVSTEAGGEGIDLQESCHTLVHVDLPWNPMRMHQRVGRLNRYGQHQVVKVITIRNPSTVESRIWDKLNEKLERIMQALAQVMDEPEDLLQMVLGMTSPSLFRNLFSGVTEVPKESISEWFDQKTSTFGGKDVIQTVLDIVGQATKFDFQQVSDRIPRVDLPDLRPFLDGALSLNGRRLLSDGSKISFLTPDAWRTNPAVREEYRDMVLDRADRGAGSEKTLLGVGHVAIDEAVAQARTREASVAVLPKSVLPDPLFVFSVQDRLTERSEVGKILVTGVTVVDGRLELLPDWQLLKRLNELPPRKAFMLKSGTRPIAEDLLDSQLALAEQFLKTALPTIEETFRVPECELQAILWPGGDEGAVDS
jgi:ERCC4-related helicase